MKKEVKSFPYLFIIHILLGDDIDGITDFIQKFHWIDLGKSVQPWFLLSTACMVQHFRAETGTR